jgi:transposase-like protein
MREEGPDSPAKTRRRWTTAEKIHLVEQTYRPGTSLSRVARRYGVSYHLLRRWRRLVDEGLLAESSDCRCALCGELFEAARTEARFCSSKCRQRAHRLRKVARSERARETPGCSTASEAQSHCSVQEEQSLDDSGPIN